MSELSDTSAVIDALGGPTEMGRRCGFKVQRVCNWRGWDHFPTDTFGPIQRELAKDGRQASHALWRSIRTDALPPEVIPSLSVLP